MHSHLCVSIRLLHPVFHGRGEQDGPEWPPNPLRIFQALVMAGARLNNYCLPNPAAIAFEWLEDQSPPVLVTPAIVTPELAARSGYRLSVPNNSMDKVIAAWSRGNYFGSGDSNPSEHRTMKRVRPLYLREGDIVQCIWTLAENDFPTDEVFKVLRSAAGSVVSLGWGIDMAVGSAALLTDMEVAELVGIRWLPGKKGVSGGLRVPVKGTLQDLRRRHKQFLERVGPDGLRPPAPLTVFERYEYRRADDPPRQLIACFALRTPAGGGFRPFDPVRSIGRVAGLMRHTVATAAKRNGGWPEPATFVLGHGEKEGERHVSVNNRRFAYLPLPSIESRGVSRIPVVGSVRRICLAVFDQGYEEEIEWARQTLGGDVLVEEGTGELIACLSPGYEGDSVLKRYCEPASRWATVTPVVLPGYDDPAHFRRRIQQGVSAEEQKRLLGHLSRRIERLLRKTITDAGFSQELATHAELEWRPAGFWPGTARADRYRVPDYLARFNRLHVCVKWLNASGEMVRVPGPICLGGGRFIGLGLFAALRD